MKKPGLMGAVALLALGIVAMMLVQHFHGQTRVALVKVYRQIKFDQRSCTYPNGSQNVPRLLDLYDQVDTSACPEDFRVAFFDFRTACRNQRHHENVAALEALGALVTDGATQVLLAGSAIGSADKSLQDDPQAAAARVRRFWVQYNIGPADLK
jgi:hypothetical protein